MADPLTILTTLPSALEAIRVLYKFLDAARKHDKIIGSLFEEVQDLEGTLIDLQNAVAGAANNSAFKKIESLLRRCAEKCKNFSTLIEKCTIHSSASKSSFRDALRLRYKEDEVMEFKQTLNSLKLTIDMALHAVTWSKTDDNGAELKRQQELFTKTITTLEDRLAKQDEKLKNLCGSDSHLSGKDTEEKIRLLSEKASTQQCISLCTAFSKQIELHRKQVTANRKALRDPDLRSRAEQVTEGSLNACGDEMTQASSTLHRTAEQIDRRLLEMMSMHERSLHELQEEMKQREAERDATKDMLKLCLEYKAEAANQHACIFQDMMVEEGGFQMIINTKGGGITASGGKTARMACQVGGEMEDATAQKITESHFISIRGSPSRYRSETLQSVHK